MANTITLKNGWVSDLESWNRDVPEEVLERPETGGYDWNLVWNLRTGEFELRNKFFGGPDSSEGEVKISEQITDYLDPNGLGLHFGSAEELVEYLDIITEGFRGLDMEDFS